MSKKIIPQKKSDSRDIKIQKLVKSNSKLQNQVSKSQSENNKLKRKIFKLEQENLKLEKEISKRGKRIEDIIAETSGEMDKG